MTLKQLETFLALSRIQNFTKTASYLGCAQSGVTAQIKELEKDLNVLLFERIGKKIALTAEGERLVPYAKEILHMQGNIQNLYTDRGLLRIGISEALCTHLLSSMLKEFNTLYPHVQVTLQLVDDLDYPALLTENQIDAALVLDRKHKDKSLKLVSAHPENISLFVPFTHTLAGKSMISPEELATSYFLLPPRSCAYRLLLEKDLLALGIRPLLALESSSITALKEGALCSLGIALLPEFCVREELMYHSLERVNFKTSYPVYTQLLIHRDKWLSPDLEAFLRTAARHIE